MTTDERLEAMENAIADLAKLVRHMGQTLSWSTAGQDLNHPPQDIKDAQKRLEEWFGTVQQERLYRVADAVTVRMVLESGE